MAVYPGQILEKFRGEAFNARIIKGQKLEQKVIGYLLVKDFKNIKDLNSVVKVLQINGYSAKKYQVDEKTTRLTLEKDFSDYDKAESLQGSLLKLTEVEMCVVPYYQKQTVAGFWVTMEDISRETAIRLEESLKAENLPVEVITSDQSDEN